MAEADELCERIAIVDHGRILAIGSPGELKRRVQRESIFRLELDRLPAGPASLARTQQVVAGHPGLLHAPVAAPVAIAIGTSGRSTTGGDWQPYALVAVTMAVASFGSLVIVRIRN